MSARTYDKIMNFCVACGVLSALLFEHAGSFRLAVAGLGVLAGAVAVALYFHNHWSSVGARPTRDERPPIRLAGAEFNKAVIADPLPDEADPLSETCFSAGGSGDYRRVGPGIITGYANQLTLGSGPVWQNTYLGPVIAVEPYDPVEHVVGIIKRLSEGEAPPFEFAVCPDGSVLIRPRTEHKAASTTKRVLGGFETRPDWSKRPSGKTK